MVALKRAGNIFGKIHDIENIKLAIYNASKGKRKRRRVKVILNNIDYYSWQIKRMLVNQTFEPTKSTEKKILDGNNKKTRIIHKPNFYPDQIIHWALMQQIQDVLYKPMYQYSCGSIPKRGTGYARKTIRKWLDKDKRNTKYCLKMDVKKYYPSINNKILNQMMIKKMKDKDCLWLIRTITGDGKGLPIGYYTSQWFSNVYLNDLDHFIKQELKIKYYVRYVDDLVLFGPNKKKLHKAKIAIESKLKEIDLSVKENWQVFRVDARAVDFLGYRFFRNKTILRKRNALRIKRRVNKIKRKGYLNERDAQAVISYWGWIKSSNSYSFYHKNIKPVVTIKQAKKAVSECAKLRNNGQQYTNHKPFL